MSLLVIEGFEDAALSELWAGASGGSADTSPVRTGTRSWLLTGDGEVFTHTLASPISSTQELIVGWAVTFSRTDPGGDSTFRNLFHLRDTSANTIFELRVQGTTPGTIWVYDAAAAQVGSFSVVGGWQTDVFVHYLEVKAVNPGTASDVFVYSDGVLVYSSTAFDLTDGVNNIGDVRFLNPRNNTSNWDDIYIADGSTAGGAVSDVLGPVNVETLNANGNGATANWDGSDGNNTDNYLLVDDLPHDSDTTYVTASTANDVDLYTFQDLGTRTVYGVRATATARKDGGSESFRQVTRIGSTNYAGTTKVLTDAYVNYVEIWEVSPATSTVWASTGVNDAEFGVEVI